MHSAQKKYKKQTCYAQYRYILALDYVFRLIMMPLGVQLVTNRAIKGYSCSNINVLSTLSVNTNNLGSNSIYNIMTFIIGQQSHDYDSIFNCPNINWICSLIYGIRFYWLPAATAICPMVENWPLQTIIKCWHWGLLLQMLDKHLLVKTSLFVLIK